MHRVREVGQELLNQILTILLPNPLHLCGSQSREHYQNITTYEGNTGATWLFCWPKIKISSYGHLQYIFCNLTDWVTPFDLLSHAREAGSPAIRPLQPLTEITEKLTIFCPLEESLHITHCSKRCSTPSTPDSMDSASGLRALPREEKAFIMWRFMHCAENGTTYFK